MNRALGVTASAGLAAMAAGPVFVTLLVAHALLTTGEPVRVTGPGIFGWLAIALIAVLPGFVLAIVPAILGTTAMAAAARWNEGLRRPAVWAIAGAGAALGILLPFGADPAGEMSALVGTGAIVALLSRCNLVLEMSNSRS